MNPPGHQPGFHIPGTLVPIGAVIEQQRMEAMAQQQAIEDARKRRRNHLLLLRR